MKEVQAEVSYDPEVAALYVWFDKKRVCRSRVIKRYWQRAGCEIKLIVIDYDEDQRLAGIEMLLDPKSQLKLVLDEWLKGAEEQSQEGNL